MIELYKQLKEFGKVKANEKLSKHTSFKIGGPADFLIVVKKTKKLVDLLRFLEGEGIEYFILGKGTNLLVRDEGFQGVVIKVECDNLIINGEEIEADAGCVNNLLVQKITQTGLTGLEWLVGVPGTIGAAVRGNAGIPDQEMKDIVVKVQTYQDGEVLELTNQECEFGYRDSIFKRNNSIILKIWLKLKKGKSEKNILEYLQRREQNQPKGHSAGCVFKNPTDKSAGRLIEQAGLKGKKVGDAQVSELHANFIINLGEATANDVLTLIEEIKERVYNKFKVNLEEEIQII